MDKYWRKGASNPLSGDDRNAIRSRLFESGVTEQHPQLALQNSLVISKIVRMEYPGEWPTALTELIAILRNVSQENQQLHLQRGLLVLLQITKELASARLRISQTALQSVTPEIVFLLSNIYTQKVNQWYGFLTVGGDDEGGAMDAMDSSLLALKILRRLLIAGYERPNEDKEVQSLWAQSQNQFGQLWAMISAEPQVIIGTAKNMVEKHLLQLSKLHLEMSKIHPASFAALPNSIELVRGYWGLVVNFSEKYGSLTNNPDQPPPEYSDDGREVLEKLCLKGLSLIRACLKMIYKPSPSFVYRSGELKEQQKAAIKHVKTELFTDELVSNMASVIVTKFFTFRGIDMEAWEDELEEWEAREDANGDGWEFEVRPCSEKLFMDLVLNYKNLLVPPLLNFFQSVGANNPDFDQIILKDSVYTAMGLAAPVLAGEFSFDDFLSTTIVGDMSMPCNGPVFKVLHRRIAILLGQWITIMENQDKRPLVYQIFENLLDVSQPGNDIVVSLTAARHMKTVIDDYSFKPQQYLPYAEKIFTHLISLIQQVQNVESKMAILNTIRVVAVRLEEHIVPFADGIVNILPDLWTASGEEHLMKQAILTLLSTIVTAMRSPSSRYNSLILPLIQRAVEDGSDMQVYLLEEALDLWSNILQQTPTTSKSDVIMLIDSIFPLLEGGGDNLRNVLVILESYIILAPEVILSDTCRLRVLSYMTSLLGLTKRELAGLVTSNIELILQAAEYLGGQSGVAAVAKDLVSTGYIEKVLTGLHEAHEAHQTFGPNRKYPKLDNLVETDYFTVLARLCWGDPSTFMACLAQVGGDAPQVWSWLSTEWFRHFDCMANVERQKLSCMALTKLIELPAPMSELVVAKLQDYLAMWTATVAELCEGQVGFQDVEVWSEEKRTQKGEWECSAEDERKRLLDGMDPVHIVHIFDFVKAKLGDLVVKCGGEDVFQREALANCDVDVVKAFQMLGQQQEMP